ncbi:MAG: B12-binding domain-containing radical SAM protein, partial [Candidatus Shapirobacteria bacterium]
MLSTKKPENILAVKSVSISYPPLESEKGSAFLSQNRQFQWTNTGNVIYPIIPAYAATFLKTKGLKIFWDDAIAEKLTYKDWFKRILKNKPDMVVIETKTPVIKRHWKIINELKKESLKFKNWKLKIILMGDHVTALPKESIKNCKVDYILIGGDYDFLLDELITLINNKEAPKDKIFKSQKKYDLNSLPIIDRKLTQWQLYAYNNTNYKYKPGSYIMSGRHCWWGRCKFCSWCTLFPGKNFRH